MWRLLKDLFLLITFRSTVQNGAVCRLSKYIDLHDYHVSKGGDGIPTHMHIYKCNFCGKEFII